MRLLGTVNDQLLTKMTRQISLDFFQRPFKHQIYFNRRLQTTGGRYLLKSHNIEINPKVWQQGGQQLLVGVIKHELCHYHLHLQQQDASHRSIAFKQLLRSVGGVRYVPWLMTINYHYLYRCQNCGHQYQRQRRINTNRLVCGICRGKLKLVKHN